MNRDKFTEQWQDWSFDDEDGYRNPFRQALSEIGVCKMLYDPTCEEIAANFDLWGEYVDPAGTTTKEKFDSLSVQEKVKIIHETFPGSCNCKDDTGPGEDAIQTWDGGWGVY